jgi:hypothetical protein
MCISVGTMLMAGLSIASTGMTMMGAQAEAGVRRAQIDTENRQLAEEREMLRIQAMKQENERLEEHRKLMAQNEAWLGASGLAENMAYEQAVIPANETAMKRDAQTIALNAQARDSRIADQIHINKMERQHVGTKAKLQVAQSLLDGVGRVANSAASSASNRSTYATGRG